MMGQLFDVLDQKKLGMVSQLRVHELAEALKQGCDASNKADERDAVCAFVSVLKQMAKKQRAYSRVEWLAYVPAAGSYSPAHEKAFLAMLGTILGSEEAAQGLVNMLDADATVTADGSVGMHKRRADGSRMEA